MVARSPACFKACSESYRLLTGECLSQGRSQASNELHVIQVPRVHALAWLKIKSTEDLPVISFKSSAERQAQVAELRQAALSFLQTLLFGDQIAAQYVLLQLVSRSGHLHEYSKNFLYQFCLLKSLLSTCKTGIPMLIKQGLKSLGRSKMHYRSGKLPSNQMSTKLLGEADNALLFLWGTSMATCRCSSWSKACLRMQIEIELLPGYIVGLKTLLWGFSPLVWQIAPAGLGSKTRQQPWAILRPCQSLAELCREAWALWLPEALACPSV